MDIKLHPEVETLLQGADAEQLVNDIVMVYLKGGFLRLPDVVYRVKVDKVYRRRSREIADLYDDVTHEFKGVAVLGESKSESLWIPDVDLHDAIEENDEVVVLKSPRKDGISVVDSEDRYKLDPPNKEEWE